MNEFGFVRVTAVSPILKVGDPDFNTTQTLQVLERVQDSDIVVFPELGITGYTCGDLFRQDTLYYSIFEQLIRLCDYSKEHPFQLIFVGAPFRLDNSLYNCAVAINNGRVVGIVPKQNIPNYNEFYEGRWFRRATGQERQNVALLSGPLTVPFGTNLIFWHKDVGIMAEICEDLWMPIPPSSYAALAGAHIMVNLSASNETVAKCEYRRALVAQQSGRCMSAYLYASAGPKESTSDVVFGGHCLIAENSHMLIESERVGDGKLHTGGSVFITADVDVQKLQAERRCTTSFGDASNNTNQFRAVRIELLEEETPKPLIQKRNGRPFVPQNETTLHNRCAEVFVMQVAGLAKRIERLGAHHALQSGISGGLDSTLAALVAAKACKVTGFKPSIIKAITMPGFGTTPKTKTNALALMEHLGFESDTIDIRPACLQTFRDIKHSPFGIDLGQAGEAGSLGVEGLTGTLAGLDPEVLAQGDLKFENVQARQRTYLLMSRGFVLGTGDLSELALGWCTYNGDHMSMYNVNCSIPKTLVKFLVNYVAMHEYDEGPIRRTLLDIVGTTISPELLPHNQGEIVQSTEDVLGPYELHDFYLFYLMRNGFSPRKIWYLANNATFTQNYGPELKLKTLRTFITRFFSQQFKRNCVPDGPKVGSVSLSPRGDWRMPSDAEATAWLAQLDEIKL